VPPSPEDRPIVVAGEALVDLLAREDGSLEAHGGGGPFNAARTVGRLEQPVVFLGVLSDDVFGRRLRASLADEGVVVHPDLTSPLPTTLALAEIDDRGSATYRFYVMGTSAPALTPTHTATIPSSIHSLHVGALGLVFEPIASTLLSLLAKVKGTAIVSVDPNCRPHAIGDLDAYRSVVAQAIGTADLVKLSEEDADVLLPGMDTREAAYEFLRQGPKLVVLTRGPRGATAFSDDWEFDVPAPEVDVVDTVGAGDAFSGALLSHFRRQDQTAEDLLDREAVQAALEFAAQVAAIVCSRLGADLPRLADLGATSA
jgi:fructokinase